MTMRGPITHRRAVIAALLGGAALVPVARGFAPVRHPPPIPRGTPGPLPPVAYDQGMGETDATGLVKAFPLRASGALRMFVDGVAGSPRYNGLSPYPGYRLNGSGPHHQVGATGRGAPDPKYGPAAGWKQALDPLQPLVRPEREAGEGWQIFLAEGQRFRIDPAATGWPYLRGHSKAFPCCLQSYDPRDPLDPAKHGRAGTAGQGARPILTLGPGGAWPSVTRGDPVAYDNWVFRGLMLVNPTDTGQAFGNVFCANNVLIENCVFDGVSILVENFNPAPGFDVSRNVIVRRVASYGQYDVNGAHACGLYSSNVALTVEDSVFYHCGWKIGVGRETPVSAGGPDIFKHCLYIHGGNGTSATLRRIVMVDGSASGLSLRGAHLCHHNVIVDCPTPDFKGGGSASDADSPDGVLQRAYAHLVVGGADITPREPRGQGFSCSASAKGSYYAYNLFVDNPKFGEINNVWMQVAGNIAGQHNTVRIFGNRAYAFAPVDRMLYHRGPYPEAITVVQSDNLSQDETPATAAQLYRSAGFASKQALVDAMIADPMRDWAYLLLGVASRAFGFDFGRVPLDA